MVGIRIPSSGANGTAPFVASDVAFRPKEFAGTITNDWTTVPWCTTDFSDYDNTATDHLVQVHNPATGIGDVCRYMGVADGASWRIPTAEEWAVLYGSPDQNRGQAAKLGDGWVEGSYYPLSGYAMGAGWKYVSISGSGANAHVTNADPWINGAVFIPPSGNRSQSGEIVVIGYFGFCWSTTASTPTYGHYMRFDSLEVWPQYSSYRTNAFPIRCIRE